MRYVDTSVLVAYLTPEPASAVAEEFMMSEGDPLAISSWTEVEFLSALELKLRRKELDRHQAQQVVDAYSRLVSPQLRRLDIDEADHRQALSLMIGWRTSLRGGDGLHLAIASANGATVHTLDRGMADAAVMLGIPVRVLG